MSVIASVHITGFWGDRTVQFDLNDTVNFLIGQNGSGKTTAINLMAAAMTADTESLARLPFEVILISLYDQDTRRRPSIAVSKNTNEEFVYPDINYKIKESATGRVKDYSLLQYPDERRLRAGHYVRTRSRSQSDREYRPHLVHLLRSIAPVSWLSVHRTTATRQSGERQHRDYAVDQKIHEINERLVRYFAELAVLASNETRNFQRKFFLSLIEAGHAAPRLESFVDHDDGGDRDALIEIYRRFEVPEREYIKQTTEFFDTVQQLQERSQDESQGYTMRELVHLINSWRVHSLVGEWSSTVEKEKEALKPRDAFVNVLNRMFHRKEAQIQDNNELAFITDSGKSLTAFELSSGEKQLYIIFAEAVLQRGKACIYIADEPELSLHINWQEVLVDNLRELNPRSQIVFATHSPDIVSHYSEKLIDMEKIVT